MDEYDCEWVPDGAFGEMNTIANGPLTEHS